MISSPFEYRRPETLEEATRLLAELPEPRVLAGGHSLLPAMKLGLSQPGALVDLGRIGELQSIVEESGRIAIGAMVTHRDIEASDLLARLCPLLPQVAGRIGDLQVRNRGTMGGSLAHADPAADWPAAILALDGELEIAGKTGRRSVPAGQFFVDLFQTALQPGEILSTIRVPRTGKTVAYEKFAQKASGFALCGVAAVIDGKRVRIGVTGVAARPYRATAVESALGGSRSAQAIAKASELAAQGVEPMTDLSGSAAYRAHLAQVLTRRALTRAVA